MIAELHAIQGALGTAQAILLGMTQSLSQVLSEVFGPQPLSTEDAVKLMKEGKRVDLL